MVEKKGNEKRVERLANVKKKAKKEKKKREKADSFFSVYRLVLYAQSCMYSSGLLEIAGNLSDEGKLIADFVEPGEFIFDDGWSPAVCTANHNESIIL